MTDSSALGIWAEDSFGVVGLAAYEGAQAPGTTVGTTFDRIDSVLHNSAGQTAFRSYARGDSSGRGIWSEGGGSGLRLIARTRSTHAPGTPTGTQFSSISPISFNGAGQTAFSGSLIGSGVIGLNNRGVWSEGSGKGLQLVVRSSNQAPGTRSGVRFSGFFTDVRINDAGLASFIGYIRGPGVTGGNDQGIWSEAAGSGVQLVVRSRDPAPGAPVGVEFESFENQVINGAGQTAFIGELLGTGVDSTNDRGLWAQSSGGELELVARTGDAAPGTPAGVNFARLGTYVFNSSGQVAFSGFLTGTGVDSTNDVGIWALDSSGTLALIAREGDALDVGNGTAIDLRVINDIYFAGGSGNEDGYQSGFNETGQLAFTASFTDGTWGAFVSNQVAIPESASVILISVMSMVGLFTRHRRFSLEK
ncbi:MAG: hypothetical protein RH917_07370 [Lacipirellulaceae bacterium]